MLEVFSIMKHLYSVTNQMEIFSVWDVCEIVDSYEQPNVMEITESEYDVGGINIEIYHYNIDIYICGPYLYCYCYLYLDTSRSSTERFREFRADMLPC